MNQTPPDSEPSPAMATIQKPAGAAAELRPNIPLGIGLMLLGIVMFSANDALGKWLAGTYSPGQILMFRSVFALIVITPIVWKAGFHRLFALDRPLLQVFRLACATVETFLFYWAVSVLPLADAMTYYLAGPIYVTIMAALVLGEPVRWRRWAAVIVGFLGVLIALQPSAAAFGRYALIAFAGSVIYAIFLVATRYLRGTPDSVMAFWQFATSLLFGAATAPFGAAPLTSVRDVLLIGLLGVTALAAIVCVNRSLKLAPASVVVPYQNTMIVWAIIFGFFFFGDVPGWNLLLGAAIIVVAGTYIFFREQRVAPRPEPDVAPVP